MWLRAGAGRRPGAGQLPRQRQRHRARAHVAHLRPFFTTKLGQGGSGLGLSISYNIVTSLMGGQISVHSSRDGTTFTLDLPLTAPEHQRPAPPRSTIKAAV
jgi:signal transduction histidine kinase